MLNALRKDILLVSLRGRVKLESVTLLAFNCLPSPFLPLWRQNQEQRKCGFEKRWKHLFTCGALSPRLPACLALGFLQLCFLLPWSSSVLTSICPVGILTQFNQSKHGYNHQNSMRGRCDHLSRAKLILGRPPRLTPIRIIVIGNNRNMYRQVSPLAESSCEVLYGSSYNRSPNQNASPIHHNFEIQTFIKLSS